MSDYLNVTNELPAKKQLTVFSKECRLYVWMFEFVIFLEK
jgi:hypothetical protein